ncbi:MAG TPA: RNA polymerase sigma-70 factor [Vicinamibacterales bacterium]|nr:RNA polymerase sigma-70 factor [Vicinamibacterales bacterium]
MTEIDLFQTHRSALFAVAYRMLGSATDAEDVLQDAWLRFAAARPSDLRSAKAYLTTIVTRLCLDRLKSARAMREEYVGPWLPEPVVTSDRSGPERSLAQAESVTLAFMVLLETLSPEERAVFLLREVFDYEYDEIAEMLDMSGANCRQLFHRAKGRIAERKPRFRASMDEKRPLVERFLRAFSEGSEAGLTSVLAEDIGFWSDGGGKVLAARRPIFGREQVVRLLLGLRRTASAVGVALESVSFEIVEVNGEPALLLRVAGCLDGVYVMAVEEGAITAIRVVRNPDKLTYIEHQTAH